MIIQGFWHGCDLSRFEYNSILSYLQNGYEYHLYTYDIIGNIPNGVIIKDANEIIPKTDIFYYYDSITPFSDLFRYKMLYDKGGIWTDCDIFCLHKFDDYDEYIFATERTIRKVEIKRKKENGEVIKRGKSKGWKHSPEAIDKIKTRSNQEDNKLRIKEIQKISSKKRVGKHHSKEVKLKMVVTRFGGIKEIEIYKSGELINTCNFISEASEITGTKSSAIKNNLCGLSKTAGGYIFKYKNLL